MPAIDDMLAAAATRADELATPGVNPAPRRRVAVVTCMDARIDVPRLLGLRPGDAHVIRNAGGLVTDDVVRSLAISQRKLGTAEVALIMHERCGLHGASDEEFARALADDGAEPAWRLGGFDDLAAAVRDGVARLRSARELPRRDEIRGFVFDPDSGALRELSD